MLLFPGIQSSIHCCEPRNREEHRVRRVPSRLFHSLRLLRPKTAQRQISTSQYTRLPDPVGRESRGAASGTPHLHEGALAWLQHRQGVGIARAFLDLICPLQLHLPLMTKGYRSARWRHWTWAPHRWLPLKTMHSSSPDMAFHGTMYLPPPSVMAADTHRPRGGSRRRNAVREIGLG